MQKQLKDKPNPKRNKNYRKTIISLIAGQARRPQKLRLQACAYCLIISPSLSSLKTPIRYPPFEAFPSAQAPTIPFKNLFPATRAETTLLRRHSRVNIRIDSSWGRNHRQAKSTCTERGELPTTPTAVDRPLPFLLGERALNRVVPSGQNGKANSRRPPQGCDLSPDTIDT